MKAVIDRFEGDYAVMFFVPDEIQVDIPRRLLPRVARKATGLTSFLNSIQKKRKKEGLEYNTKWKCLKKVKGKLACSTNKFWCHSF